MNKILTPADKIIVALDTEYRLEAINITKQILPIIKKVKVGMELFYSEGPRIIDELNDLGAEVFIDLKVHDIPNTAAGAAASITKLKPWMWNVHVAGGLKMMINAKENAKRIADDNNISMPLIIGVTQLTSTSQEMLENEIGINSNIKDTVIKYALLAKKAGLDGVVASAHEVPYIKEVCGKSFITVTPGIRIQDSNADDQVRITTPKVALDLGTDYMVIGRNITKANNPYEKAKEIVATLL